MVEIVSKMTFAFPIRAPLHKSVVQQYRVKVVSDPTVHVVSVALRAIEFVLLAYTSFYK